jgi:hypothetical protein
MSKGENYLELLILKSLSLSLKSLNPSLNLSPNLSQNCLDSLSN